MPITDLRIGAIQDFIIYRGETVQVTITVKDKLGVTVDLTGATLESMLLFKRTSATPDQTWIAGTDVTIVAGKIVINTDKSLIGKSTYKYELPIRPSGGGRAIMNGKIKVNDRG